MKLYKQLSTLGTITVFLLYSCSSPNTMHKTSNAQDQRLTIGVLEAYGGASTCVRETIGAIALDGGMQAIKLSPNHLAEALQDLEVLIIPGGSGSKQYLDLGDINRDKIRSWVENGGTTIGICAGAYLLSNTPEYACMRLSGAKAIDIEHDHRGHGIVKVTLDDAGHRAFPSLSEQDTLYLMYYEGPVLIPSTDEQTTKYQTLATMQSDVHIVPGTPSGMTNNKPFLTETKVGKGTVYSIVGHPEATPGMQWMIPELIRYALGLERIDYGKAAATDLFGKEILASQEIMDREERIIKELMLGTAGQKIAAIEFLSAVCSWDGKSWVRGLLYDADPSVRLAAARYMTLGRYTAYIDDMRRLSEGDNTPLSTEIAQEVEAMEGYLFSTSAAK